MATLKCPYCGSPIPAGGEACRSCQMSGEVVQPGEAHARKVADARYITIVVAAVIAGILALAILYVLNHR